MDQSWFLCKVQAPTYLHIHTLVAILFPRSSRYLKYLEISRYTHNKHCLTAAAAKSLQLRPTLCDPIDITLQALLPLGFSRQEHWSGLPFPSPVMKVESESEVTQSCSTTPWTAAHQAPQSMGFSRQEYWCGVPLLSPILKAKYNIYFTHKNPLFISSNNHRKKRKFEMLKVYCSFILDPEVSILFFKCKSIL